MAKKQFKAGAYGVIAAILVAVMLIGLTAFAFISRYNGFSDEKIALSYADTIVQTGDGYNALKVSAVSKNQKFGTFVTDAYMAPYINDGEEVEQNPAIGTGTEEEAQLLDSIYNTMYDFFLELINNIGLENYDEFYSTYFAKLKEVRADVLNDEYMDTDFMFSVFESNVETYGESLTGTEEKLADDEKTVIKEASTGIYQTMFGTDYKLTATVKDKKILSDDEVKAYADGYKDRIVTFIQNGDTKAENLESEKQDKMIAAYDNLNVADSINGVSVCTVSVCDDKGNEVASTEINVIKIGNTWYVDNTNSDTSPLYLAYSITPEQTYN